MAISFEESRKAAMANLVDSVSVRQRIVVPAFVNNDTLSEDNNTVSEVPSVYAASETWVRATNYSYPYYSEFTDELISTINSSKTISLNPGQINISQEDKAQYIPFEMPRYFDGMDLSKAVLRIYFVNKEGNGGFSQPVNVQYSDTKIRFGWLVDQNVTAIAGKVSFEIHANGTNSRNEPYTWKTRPSHDINILESLSYEALANPGESWITSFFEDIDARIETAQSAASEATGAVAQIKEYAEQASASAQEALSIISDAKQELEQTIDSAIDEKIVSVLDTYYTKEESEAITDAIERDVADIKLQIDNMDGLANFSVEYDGRTMIFYNGETVMKEININSDPSEEWTAAYTATVDEKIGVVSKDLDDLSKDVAGLPETLATDYYTKTASDDRFATKSDTETNKTNIGTLGSKITELEKIVNSVDTSPRLTYDIVYNDPEDENGGENKLVVYEIENEGKENEVRSPKRVYTIVGGGGGGGSAAANTLYINYVTDQSGNKVTSYIFTVDNIGNEGSGIYYDFSGTDPVGDIISYANATWQFRRGTSGSWTTIASETIYPNANNLFSINKYISTAGSYQFKLVATDETGGYAAKTWTVELIDLRLESGFNDKNTYPVSPVAFDYTPHGGTILKDIHFILDGVEIKTITTTSSGIPNPVPFEIPAQSHGSHLLEAYITADLNGNSIESNHIFKDILWFDATMGTPVIGCTQQEFTALQYDTTNIVYTVHDPTTETPSVSLEVDGVVVSTRTIDTHTQIWQYKSVDVGEHELTIRCGDAVKTLRAVIEKLNINVVPVTLGLAFDFDPTGRTNTDSDREWSSGSVNMSVSDNFDWVNGGYQLDANGDQYFCIKAGTSAVIDYQLFADDSKKNGKEFKFVFKSTNVQRADATFLHCIDNTTGSNHIGIQMNVHEAFIYGEVDSLQLPYSENDIIEFEFNISKDIEAVPMVMGYEDGVSTRPMVYDGAFNFTQNTPKYISLGSDYCDLHIYRFKVYNTSLNARGILNNFIADARNADEMIARYNRNQIYDENQNLDPDILAEKCPWLRVYKLSAPYFTNKKSDKVPGTTIQQIYNNGDRVLDNWTCYNAQHSGQGTSSDEYGAAGRNIDFIMNKSGVDGIDPYFVLGDGTEATEITMTRTSVPVAYLNFKANIASSNNMTNAMLANRYNEFEPYKRPFVRDDGVDTSYIKDTMQFANAVVFIQETNEDISTHREFADTSWHFYAIGNIGDSKKTDKTRLNDPTDKYECCVEIMDVELPLSDWPVDTMYNAMGYNIDKTTGEKIYIWAKDENLGILYEKIDGEYVLTQDTTVDLDKTYYVDILIHDDFSEDFTYGWRYIYEGDDDDENAEVADYCHRRWNELYRFVTTSSDEDFKVHFSDYFVTDSALYNYLFTTRYCLADNRAKNTFWHYAKTGEVDSDGNPIRKWDLTWGYDMDF